MTKEELFAKAESLIAVSNYSDAFKLVASYQNIYATDPHFRLVAAKALAGVYHHDEAMAILKGLLNSQGVRKYDVLKEIGLIQEKIGTIDPAIETYKAMVEIRPKEPYYPKMHIAKLQFKQGHAIDAINTLISIKYNDSGQKDLLLAKIYRAIGLNYYAKNVLDYIVVDEQNQPLMNKLYLQRAYLAYEEDDYETAKSNLDKIKTINEKHLLEKRVLNYKMLFKSGGSEAARKAVINEFKDYTSFRWLTADAIGDMYFYEKKYDLARSHYQKAFTNSSDYYNRYRLMIKMMKAEFRCNDIDAAMNHYDRVIKNDALGKEANYAMIEEYLNIGDLKNAKKYYERITAEQIELDPEKHRKYSILLGNNNFIQDDYLNQQLRRYSYELLADKVLSHKVQYGTLQKDNILEIIPTIEKSISNDNKVGTSGMFDEYLIGGFPTIGYDEDWNELSAFRVKTIIGTKRIVDMIPRVDLNNSITIEMSHPDIGTK